MAEPHSHGVPGVWCYDDHETCKHCGKPIMAMTFPSTLNDGTAVWVHVPEDGPVYLLIACGLVATPHRLDTVDWCHDT